MKKYNKIMVMLDNEWHVWSSYITSFDEAKKEFDFWKERIPKPMKIVSVHDGIEETIC